jgi:hypothetical protein
MGGRRDGWCQEIGRERNWRNAARNRDSWQKFQKKALAQSGQLCQWWWWLSVWLYYGIKLTIDRRIRHYTKSK